MTGGRARVNIPTSPRPAGVLGQQTRFCLVLSQPRLVDASDLGRKRSLGDGTPQPAKLRKTEQQGTQMRQQDMLSFFSRSQLSTAKRLENQAAIALKDAQHQADAAKMHAAKKASAKSKFFSPGYRPPPAARRQEAARAAPLASSGLLGPCSPGADADFLLLPPPSGLSLRDFCTIRPEKHRRVGAIAGDVRSPAQDQGPAISAAAHRSEAPGAAPKRYILLACVGIHRTRRERAERVRAVSHQR